MPPTEKHFVSSQKRTGQEYQELHRWIDADDQATKNLRHDFTRIWMYGPELHARFGEQGVREYIEHLREDMEGKFRKVLGEPSEALREAFSYFGITSGGKPVAVHPRIMPADLALLRQAGMVEADITHSLAVANKALELAGRMGDIGLDLDLVARGALFHDLGKSRTHAMEHGRIGAELGRELGLPEAVTVIMEKHIRGGLTEAEAIELGLPVKDYTLSRLEERIIIYADRLVDIIHDGIATIREESEAEKRFVEILNSNIKYGKNEITMKRYLGYHEEIQGLIAGRIIVVAQLKERLAQGGVTLLDVRRGVDREGAPAMIPGAVWRDPEQVGQWGGELSGGLVVIYCARGGAVSQAVSNKLREKNVAVAYLDGGLKAWADHGEKLA